MRRLTDPDEAAREVIAACEGDIRLALPLGIGKPVTLVNALVRMARDDPSINLTIFTALTLEPPIPTSDIQRRFLEPAMDRLFGDYPALLYADMLRDDGLPPNIEVNEFFLMAGQWLGVASAQQRYISANYTHALDVLVRRRPNVLAQLVAEENGVFSLSSNTDISTDLFRLRDAGELDFLAIAETNAELPFLYGDGAVRGPEDFEIVYENPEPFELFSALKRPVGLIEHAIGLHVSRLVEDGGTIQIGIGSIGDAIAHALILRDRGAVTEIQDTCTFAIERPSGTKYEIGLHVVTEMLVGGALALFEEGIARREVDGRSIYAAFFVESRDFYRRLRTLSREDRQKIAMVPVSFTNSLYGDEPSKRAARTKACFINSAMKVSLLGDVMSDSVEDGQVVSGVGGQFNFVEQAMALEDGRSAIVLPATRYSDSELENNIVWEIPSTTVPRHMRDLVVTEYGIADLRGKRDADVIAALISVADSRFQPELVQKAQKAGKLPGDFNLPDSAGRNYPETVETWLQPYRSVLPSFPFGTDFNKIEQTLLPALQTLSKEAGTARGKAKLIQAAFFAPKHPDEHAAMDRMGFLGQRLGISGLALRGALRLSSS